MGRLRRRLRRLTGQLAERLPQGRGPGACPLAGGEARPVTCQSCAARMQMAVDDWLCPVCGWWWAVTGAPGGIEAVGGLGGQDHLVVLDITGWAEHGN